jgi:2,4-dienoyl-CoA reductase-like NADH-dependent reductase (Old Yellow Enzyme family)
MNHKIILLTMQQHEQINWSTPIKMGSLTIKNRVCMAALTRQRCNPLDGIPN